MSDKLKYFVFGTLTTGAVYTIGLMMYTQYKSQMKKKKKLKTNLIEIDGSQYNGKTQNIISDSF